MRDQTYLGDGLYVSFDGYQIEIRANDPEHSTDTVYLPFDVMEALKRFADECWRKKEESEQN